MLHLRLKDEDINLDLTVFTTGGQHTGVTGVNHMYYIYFIVDHPDIVRDKRIT